MTKYICVAKDGNFPFANEFGDIYEFSSKAEAESFLDSWSFGYEYKVIPSEELVQ